MTRSNIKQNDGHSNANYGAIESQQPRHQDPPPSFAIKQGSPSSYSSQPYPKPRIEQHSSGESSGLDFSASSRSCSSCNNETQQSSHSVWGILFIMLGAFSFSVMFLVVKLMKSTNSFTLVYYRSLVQIVISLATLLYQGQNPLGPTHDLDACFYLVLRAIFGAAAVCAWFFGIQELPLPDAVTLQFTTPPFAAAFAMCLVGEKWLPMDIVGAIVCLTGVALIAHPTWLFGGRRTSDDAVVGVEEAQDDSSSDVFLKALAVFVTTGGAAMAGIAYVCVRKIGNRASAIVMVLYYGTLSIPLTMVGSYFLQGTWNVWSAGPKNENFTAYDWFLLLLMGLGGYGGQWLTNLGLQRETAATATLATSTQIVWTYVFELAFLHESIDGWSVGGTALILGYMLLVAFLKLFSNNDGRTPKSAASTPDSEVSRLLEHQGSSSLADDVENGGRDQQTAYTKQVYEIVVAVD